MARNQVMKLWTIIVSAFLALFTALGFVTTTTAAAVPQSEASRNSTMVIVTAMSPWGRSLPPTMKQRIRAEAHGKSPRCRHRPLTDAEPTRITDASCTAAAPIEPTAPLRL